MTDAARLSAALEGRYVVERELGEGGMATVYLAQDVRHDRQVALKVLRPELAAILGAERFLAEIRTTANLQHPHILPLHDSGEADGTVFYVMPYVEGESLRDRLTREHQLPVDDAVRIATEVASALDYAHRHGVVHRDIKPENILLHDGSALVADFGIALAVSSAGGGKRMTETGMSLGTPHYMAPEQAMGEKDITPRADVYALGCVLYEMLTAEPPFDGATAQAIVARVMTEQPRSLTIQRHTIPPHVEAATMMALEKLPADRFATAAQFAEALTKPGAIPATRVRAAVAGGTVPGWRTRLTVPLAAVAVLSLGVAAWALLRPAPEEPPYQFALSFPAGRGPDPRASMSISNDGSRLLFWNRAGLTSPWRVWVKEADRFDAAPLAGTDGADVAVFAPDGEWVAFVQNGQLKKVRVTGGAAVTLADRANANLLAWLDDGTLVYGQQPGARHLMQIAETGGTPRTVWVDSTVNAILNLSPLPGARGVLAVTFTSGSGPRLSVVNLRDSTSRVLQEGVLRGVYVRTGHIIFVRPDGAMLALPFDLKRFETSGAPVPVRDSVGIVFQRPLFDVSQNGTLVVRGGAVNTSAGLFHLVWVDRNGRESPVDTSFTFRNVNYGSNAGWALSPDGSRLAIGINTDAGDDIWVKQLPTGPAVRVTFDSTAEYRPRWTPDGRRVLFSSNRQTAQGLYERPADGTGHDSLVLAGSIFEGELSADGRWLLARAGGQVNQTGGRNIGAMRIGRDTALVPLVATAFDESEIALSPDGRWLAYVSDETGRPEVFIRPFPAVDSAKIQVSVSGGVAPLWARNGRELFFVNANREMMVVPVAPGPVLRLGERAVLFRLGDDLYLAPREYYTPFDISPDGRRFIMARAMEPRGAEEEIASPVIVTQHWFTELRRMLAGR